MNKICGYSCEHNKSGICQISVCDKRPIMSDKTEIKHLSQSYYDLHEKYYKLQQENKILKENAENNDKVVDKVNWENMLLKKENKQLQEELECTIGIVEHNRIISEKNNEIHQLKDKISKIETLIINHNCDTGDIYYKYNSKFLKSELKQRILEIVYEKGSDSNE